MNPLKKFLLDTPYKHLPEQHRKFYEWQIEYFTYFDSQATKYELEIPPIPKEDLTDNTHLNSFIAHATNQNFKIFSGIYFSSIYPQPLVRTFNVKEGKVYDFTKLVEPEKTFYYAGIEIPLELAHAYLEYSLDKENPKTLLEFYYIGLMSE